MIKNLPIEPPPVSLMRYHPLRRGIVVMLIVLLVCSCSKHDVIQPQAPKKIEVTFVELSYKYDSTFKVRQVDTLGLKIIVDTEYWINVMLKEEPKFIPYFTCPPPQQFPWCKFEYMRNQVISIR